MENDFEWWHALVGLVLFGGFVWGLWWLKFRKKVPEPLRRMGRADERDGDHSRN